MVESRPRSKKNGAGKIAKSKPLCPACGSNPAERGYTISVGPARVKVCARCGTIGNAAMQVLGFLTGK